MFSLRDLRFVLCSRDLDVLRAQRIMGFFILITHKSPPSENLITWKARRSTESVNYGVGVLTMELECLPCSDEGNGDYSAALVFSVLASTKFTVKYPSV